MVQTQKEIVKQIAIADKLFLTKSDLIDSAELMTIKKQIRELNNSAQMIVVTQGKVSPLELMNLGLSSTKSSSKILSFLGEQTESGKYLGQFVQAHDSGIQTLSLRFTDPFTWEAFSSALDLLSNLRGPDLLRMKGIINVSGQPVVVQGVQHIFHPPVHLKDWPSDDHDSRMVFITRHIEAQLIRNLFDTVRLLNH
jgi:G3E family GTPase